MPEPITSDTLHRTAKYFMDSGKAASAEAALALLGGFAITVLVGEDAASDAHGQAAVLSLVNLARRTFLGGVEVVGPLRCETIGRLMPDMSLATAVEMLGGKVAAEPSGGRPTIIVGDGAAPTGAPAWRLAWRGWRGGVVPAAWPWPLSDPAAMPLTPALAAAMAVSEAFAFFAGDHALAGRRAAGLSLWNPGADWTVDEDAPTLAFLPSRLWLLGLGNLGQAYAWALAMLPYRADEKVEFALQDFDVVGASNDSTSLLSNRTLVGRKKARMLAEWLELRGFTTRINELPFNAATRWCAEFPDVLLCGVDNALVRLQLDGAGFPLVVEAGLGAGPQAFRSIAIHTLPASRSSSEIWPQAAASGGFDPAIMPAYKALRANGTDECGLAQLASRTVGVPFVGLIAATLVVVELLRRLHGGPGVEVMSLSTLAPDAVETITMEAPVYSHGHVEV